MNVPQPQAPAVRTTLGAMVEALGGAQDADWRGSRRLGRSRSLSFARSWARADAASEVPLSSELGTRYDLFQAVIGRFQGVRPTLSAISWPRKHGGFLKTDYGQLAHLAGVTHSYWASLGVEPGSSLCIVCEPGPELALALAAGLRAGLVISVVSPTRRTYLRNRLSALDPDHVLADPQLAPWLGRFAERSLKLMDPRARLPAVLPDSYTYAAGDPVLRALLAIQSRDAAAIRAERGRSVQGTVAGRAADLAGAASRPRDGVRRPRPHATQRAVDHLVRRRRVRVLVSRMAEEGGAAARARPKPQRVAARRAGARSVARGGDARSRGCRPLVPRSGGAQRAGAVATARTAPGREGRARCQPAAGGGMRWFAAVLCARTCPRAVRRLASARETLATRGPQRQRRTGGRPPRAPTRRRMCAATVARAASCCRAWARSTGCRARPIPGAQASSTLPTKWPRC